jgi:parallel beta helix pectate lyase-like protein
MENQPLSRFGLFSILLVFVAATAHGQATRTWVSGVGDDANPCSRTAPCKTFAGAISKTATAGEISVLDPGGFGAVTITKSITIDGAGTLGGILAALVNGVIINAPVNDVVILRNLSINGAGNGTNGIHFLAGKALHVENCTISRFGAPFPNGNGINFIPSGVSLLFVKDTILNQNLHGGIFVKPGAAGTAHVSIDTVRLERNGFGLRVEDRGKATVRDSVAAGNLANGFLSFSASTGTELNLENSEAVNNGTNGVKSEGANSFVRLSNVTVMNNTGLGLSIATGGKIETFGNNRIRGNTGGSDLPNVVLSEQ